MVATDSTRDASAPQDTSRNTRRDTQFVEHGGDGGDGGDGGEGSLRAPTLRALQPSKQNGHVRHSRPTTPGIQSTAWPAGGPIPAETVATSLQSSQPNANGHKTPSLKDQQDPGSEDMEDSQNGHRRGRSASTQALLRRDSSNVSLDMAPAIYRGPDDTILYQRPQSPSISSSVYVKHAEKSPAISSLELRRLLKLRHRVKTIRLQIHAQRAQVDAKRDAQSDADEQYIKRIRTNHVTREPPSQADASESLVLEDLWRLCQAARDAHGPAVDSLLSLEYRLEIEEAKLERIEERLYEQLDTTLLEPPIISALPLGKQIDDGSQDEDYESTSPSSQESRHTDDINYNNYLRRLGNLDLLHERYQSLMTERAMLEEERARRSRVGRDLDSEATDFLARFDDIINPVSMEIAEVSEDVKRLKQLCLDKGLIDADGNPTEDSAFGEESPAESREGSQYGHPAEHSKHSECQKPSGNNELDSSIPEGLGSFIDLWLLHKLRSSSIEVLLFSCYVAACVDNLDGLRWQAEALRLWEQDGAGKNTQENVERLESYIISSIHRSFDKVSTCDGGKQHPGTRKCRSSKTAVDRISLPIKFGCRLGAKSAC